MIPFGLKVGDTFEDGGRTFEVTEIVPLGYNSRVLKTKQTSKSVQDAPVAAQEAAEQPKEEAQLDSFNTYTKTEINRLKNDELEALCKQLGLERDTGVLMKKKIIDHLGL